MKYITKTKLGLYRGLYKRKEEAKTAAQTTTDVTKSEREKKKQPRPNCTFDSVVPILTRFEVSAVYMCMFGEKSKRIETLKHDKLTRTNNNNKNTTTSISTLNNSNM